MSTIPDSQWWNWFRPPVVDELTEYKEQLGVEEYFEWQIDTFVTALGMSGPQRPLRHCLYYRTGAGKTATALIVVALMNTDGATVIAPPSTHDKWEADAKAVGLSINVMSHAKFRQKDTKLSRYLPLIVDEFHLLGGHTGMGWKKLDSLAKHLKQALIVLSATPNYNDAERVYCIQHVLDPASAKGGFLQFVYEHCHTEANQFGSTPIVKGFRNFDSAEEYLKALPYVSHVPDLYDVDPVNIELFVPMPKEFWQYGIHRRKERIVASDMEARHTISHDQRVGEDGFIRPEIMAELEPLVGNSTKPTMMFCSTSTVARALYRTSKAQNANVAIVTGDDTLKQKAYILDQFRKGLVDVLIGTASIATGPDGLDKVCDQLILVQDTDDNSLRKQLIGRIYPRGTDSDASRKQVYRLVVRS